MKSFFLLFLSSSFSDLWLIVASGGMGLMGIRSVLSGVFGGPQLRSVDTMLFSPCLTTPAIAPIASQPVLVKPSFST